MVIPDLRGRVTILDKDNNAIAQLGDNPNVAQRQQQVPKAEPSPRRFLLPARRHLRPQEISTSRSGFPTAGSPSCDGSPERALKDSSPITPTPARGPGRLLSAGGCYTIATLGTVGGTLLTTGIFFYTNHRFGWGLQRNFQLAAVQGIVYVAGGVLWGPIVKKLPPGKALTLLHRAMATIAAAGAVAAGLSRVPMAVAALRSIPASAHGMADPRKRGFILTPPAAPLASDRNLQPVLVGNDGDCAVL